MTSLTLLHAYSALGSEICNLSRTTRQAKTFAQEIIELKQAKDEIRNILAETLGIAPQEIVNQGTLWVRGLILKTA